MNLQSVAVIKNEKPVQLYACTDSISGDKIKGLLCVVSPKSPNCQLNLVFGYDVPVVFKIEGCDKAEVHISGYYQPASDSDVEDDSDEELAENTLLNGGKMVIENDKSDSDSDETDTDSEDERVDAAFINKMVSQQSKSASQEPGSDSDSEGDEDDDDDDDDSDDSESEDEEPPKKVVATPTGKKSKPSTPNSKATTPMNKGKQQPKASTPSSNKKNKQKSGEKRKR